MKQFKLNAVFDDYKIVHDIVKAKTLKEAKTKFRKLFKGKITSIKEE